MNDKQLIKENNELQDFKRYSLLTQKQQNGITYLIVAKQNSGKSTLIYNIINKMKNKHSKIIWFTSLSKKVEYDKLREKFGKDVDIIMFDEQDILNGAIIKLHKALDRQYEEYREWLTIDIKELERQYEEVKKQENMFNQQQLLKQIQQYKENEKIFSKKQYNSVQNFVVFDDIIVKKQAMGNTLSDIVNICRFVRHYYNTNVFFTMQTLTLLDKAQRDCFQVIVLFGGLSEDRLDSISEQLKSYITYDDFIKIYLESTKKQFGYLLINSFYSNTIFQSSDGTISFLRLND